MLVYVFVILLLNLAFSNASQPTIDFHIVEQIPAGMRIGSIRERYQQQGQLADAEPVKLSIIGQSNFFKIDSTSGELIVTSSIDRDRLCDQKVTLCCTRSEGKCAIPLKVQLKGQHGFFQLVSVQVFVSDLNDNPPIWIERQIHVVAQEESPMQPGIEIRAAIDPDLGINGSHTYTLVDPTHTFDIKPEVGLADRDGVFPPVTQLKLNILKRLDRETIPRYNMTLTAVDGRKGGLQLTGSVQIMVEVLDTNDHAPIFTKPSYEVEFSEKHQPNDVVLTVHATDKDVDKNGQVRYDFSPGTVEEVKRTFSLNRATGEIRVHGSLDYESIPKYTFTVIASDSNRIPRKTSAQVTIRVKDENDNAPQIMIYSTSDDQDSSQVKVPENADKDYAIAVINLSDKDAGPAGRIQCHLAKDSGLKPDVDSLFRLEPTENSLILKSLVSFDTEDMALYILTVKCSDSGEPPQHAEKTIRVVVEDVNDEVPKFTDRAYNFYVSENLGIRKQVGRVSASDRDTNLNGQVNYRLIPRPYSAPEILLENNGKVPERRLSADEINKMFTIDLMSGVILLRGELDRERQSRWDFAVLAYDLGKDSKNSTALVTVFVQDENDNVPKFNETTYVFRLMENSEAGLVVGKVSAYDADEGSHAKLHFEIDKRKYPSVPFVINKVGGSDPNTAEIMTTQKIDREAIINNNRRFYDKSAPEGNVDTDPAYYTFEIIVTDSGNKPLRSRATVTVNILDANDKSPEWIFPSRTNSAINVTRFVGMGQTIAMVKAFDRDAGNNARIHYSVMSGDPKQLFLLDPETGALHIRRKLNANDQRVHNLVLKAEDNPGGPSNESRSTTAVLKITLVDGGARERHRHPNAGDRKTEWKMGVVIVLVVSTAVIAFILILIIIFARLLVLRRPRHNHKDGSLRRGPSTMSHLGSCSGGGGMVTGYPQIYSTQTKSPSGHTLAADANGNKHEMVYYSAEALDREDPPGITCQQLSKSEMQSHGTGYKGSNSIEGLCEMNRSWLATTRASGGNHYGDTRYNELDIRDYTTLNARLHQDSMGHYYDLVRTSDDTQRLPSNKNRAQTLRGGPQHTNQPIMNATMLHGCSFTHLDAKKGSGGQQGLEELSELPPLLDKSGDGECKQGKSMQDLAAAGYRIKAKQAQYQASFV